MAAMPTLITEDAYFWHHYQQLETVLSQVMNKTMVAQPTEPVRYIAHELLSMYAPHHGELQQDAASLTSSTSRGNEWSASAWIASLPVHEHVSRALLSPSAAATAPAQLAYVRSLAGPFGREAILTLLRSGTLLDSLATELHEAARALERAEAATASELVAKFTQDGPSFSMTFSGLSTFFGGLEGLVGTPNPRLGDAIEREHCDSADSSAAFTTPNYGVTTTSATEFLFVATPERGLAKLGKDAWPSEQGLAPGQHGRVARPLSEFEQERHRINARLSGLDAPPVGLHELMAGRLYTGPMYVKYNCVLRGSTRSSTARDAERFERICCGNPYVTTLHCINSAVVKLSKLQRACRVYRGISNGT